MSYQDELNRINKTSGLSIRDCLKTLAGGDLNRSTTALANAYAGTTNKRHQDAINSKASKTGLSKQDAAKNIPTP